MNLQICYLKIDVLCEASVNFQHISQNATPATEFAPCRHLTQPWQCDSHKTRNTTRLKCCPCHAKWRWRSPKCCTCHENWNSSSENVAKVLHLPHNTTFDTRLNVTKCHTCHAKRSNAAFQTSKKYTLLQNLRPSRGRLRTVAQRRRAITPSTPRPPEWNGNPSTHSGKSLWMYGGFKHQNNANLAI